MKNYDQACGVYFDVGKMHFAFVISVVQSAPIAKSRAGLQSRIIRARRFKEVCVAHKIMDTFTLSRCFKTYLSAVIVIAY